MRDVIFLCDKGPNSEPNSEMLATYFWNILSMDCHIVNVN